MGTAYANMYLDYIFLKWVFPFGHDFTWLAVFWLSFILCSVTRAA